eukprot:3658260-Prymnesium_polylepis.2
MSFGAAAGVVAAAAPPRFFFDSDMSQSMNVVYGPNCRPASTLRPARMKECLDGLGAERTGWPGTPTGAATFSSTAAASRFEVLQPDCEKYHQVLAKRSRGGSEEHLIRSSSADGNGSGGGARSLVAISATK